MVDGVGDDLYRVISLKGRAVGEQSEKRGPHRVNIGTHIQGITTQLLGRRVGGGAQNLTVSRDEGICPGQGGDRKAEVAHLHRTIGADEAVGRLDIAVQHSGREGGFQAGDDVEDGVDRLRNREWTSFFKFVLERAASGDFHRDHRETLDFLASENVETVGMVDARGQAALAEKPLPHVRRIQLLPQHFQGDTTPCGELFGFVNRTHSAAPEQSQQPVAAEFTGEFRGPIKRQ